MLFIGRQGASAQLASESDCFVQPTGLEFPESFLAISAPGFKWTISWQTQGSPLIPQHLRLLQISMKGRLEPPTERKTLGHAPKELNNRTKRANWKLLELHLKQVKRLWVSKEGKRGGECKFEKTRE